MNIALEKPRRSYFTGKSTERNLKTLEEIFYETPEQRAEREGRQEQPQVRKSRRQAGSAR
ncbi:MAG TPA: hypothetical protein VG796_21740 [Verrucomicrobiales bacterium]|jgi:hypothetical protein|nr:hypothetical protein [Verrucomicrobiales bacterium]